MRKPRTIMMMVEGGQYELAVNPPELTVTQESKDRTIDLLNVGEVNVAGNRGLIKVTISTFLPDAGSPFYTGYAPESLIMAMKKAKNGKKTVRIIISGTDVNTLFTVSSVGETYKEGQADSYVSWAFVESRELNTQQVASWVRRYTQTGLCIRNTSNSIPKAVTALSGDTLWDMARRYYDDGERWRDIAAANGMSEDRLTAGMRLQIPQ